MPGAEGRRAHSNSTDLYAWDLLSFPFSSVVSSHFRIRIPVFSPGGYCCARLWKTLPVCQTSLQIDRQHRVGMTYVLSLNPNSHKTNKWHSSRTEQEVTLKWYIPSVYSFDSDPGFAAHSVFALNVVWVKSSPCPPSLQSPTFFHNVTDFHFRYRDVTFLCLSTTWEMVLLPLSKWFQEQNRGLPLPEVLIWIDNFKGLGNLPGDRGARATLLGTQDTIIKIAKRRNALSENHFLLVSCAQWDSKGSGITKTGSTAHMIQSLYLQVCHIVTLMEEQNSKVCRENLP